MRGSAFDQAQQVVDQVAKSVDPKKGKPPSMDGKTIVITGGNSGPCLIDSSRLFSRKSNAFGLVGFSRSCQSFSRN